MPRKHPIIKLLRQLGNDEEKLQQLLEITLSEKELEVIEDRWKIFQLLSKGSSQRSVANELQTGIATVTRGAKAYRQHTAFINELVHYLSEEKK